jgi:hypothetical protein
VSTGRCDAILEGHLSNTTVAVHPAGRVFASTGLSDGTVRIWDLVARACVDVLHEEGDFSPSWLSYTADGRHLLVGTTKGDLFGFALTAVETADAQSFAALDSQALEQILVGHMMAICGEANQIFRELNRYDYGIDAEIEFRGPDGMPEGHKIYLQLKNGASYLRRRSSDGTEVFDVKNPRHLTYWMSQPVDVYLVVRDGEERIRWMNVSRYLRERPDRESRQITFVGDDLDPAAVLQVRAEAYSRLPPSPTR